MTSKQAGKAGQAHTPGPWQVRPLLTPQEDDDPMATYVIENIKPDLDNRYYNAGEPGSQEEYDRLAALHAENEANARLIAAAPDLLDWLGDALSCLREYRDYAEEMRHIGRGFEPVGRKGHCVGAVILACQQAIAKATGQA